MPGDVAIQHKMERLAQVIAAGRRYSWWHYIQI